MGKRKPTLDAATARKLAVEAECDPKTILKVLGGGEVRTMSSRRAYNALAKAGLLKLDKAS